MGALASESALTIRDLAARASDFVATLPTIFHLLWQQKIKTDLKTHPLHLDSRIWLDDAA